MEPKTHEYETKARLCVANETLAVVKGTVSWALRNQHADILKSGSVEIQIPSLGVCWLDEIDFCKTDVDNNYMSYEFDVNGEVISGGTVLFTAPKYFRFANPNLQYEIKENEITVYADAYAQAVEIDSPDSDFILSDNYFDMNAGRKTVRIVEGYPKTIRLRSVYDIK